LLCFICQEIEKVISCIDLAYWLANITRGIAFAVIFAMILPTGNDLAGKHPR